MTESCWGELEHVICVPKNICDVEYVIVAFKIDANYDLLSIAFRFFKSSFKTDFANFLNVDKESIPDDFDIVRDSFGVEVQIQVEHSPDLPYILDRRRQGIMTGNTKIYLQQIPYSVLADSFRIKVYRKLTATTASTKEGNGSSQVVTTVSNVDSEINVTESTDTLGNSSCFENQTSCLDDYGYAICVPQRLCDIISFIVSFKIDVDYKIFRPLFGILKIVFEKLVARFLHIDLSDILNLEFFQGSLGVNVEVLSTEQALRFVEGMRESFGSGGSKIELAGKNYTVKSDSFQVKVNRGSNMTTSGNLWTLNSTLTPPQSVINVTTLSTSLGNRSSEVATTSVLYVSESTAASGNSDCSDNEESCLDDFGYQSCVPQTFCDIAHVIVTFKINANYDIFSFTFSLFKDVFKTACAKFLEFDTDSVWDIGIFRGSVGIKLFVDNSPNLPLALDKARRKVETGTQIDLQGVTYGTVSDSFVVTVIREEKLTTSGNLWTPTSTLISSQSSNTTASTREGNGSSQVVTTVPNVDPVINVTESTDTLGNSSCSENETNCLNDSGNSICVPQKMCDILSVLVSFKIDANYQLFRFMIHLLKEVVKAFVAYIFRINLNDILALDVFEGSVIVQAEIEPTSNVMSSLDEIRQSVDNGTRNVDLFGTNYMVMPNTFQVTVQRGNTTTSMYSDKPTSTPMVYPTSYNVPVSVNTTQFDVNTASTKAESTNMMETTDNATSTEINQFSNITEPILGETSSSGREAVTQSTNDTAAVVPVIPRNYSNTSVTNFNDRAITTVTAINATARVTPNATVTISQPTTMSDKIIPSDKESKETVTKPVSTRTADELTTSDIEDKETVTVPVSSSMPEDITTSNIEDKETVTVPVSTRMPEDITTSGIEDKETVTVPVTTYLSQHISTSDIEETETVATDKVTVSLAVTSGTGLLENGTVASNTSDLPASIPVSTKKYRIESTTYNETISGAAIQGGPFVVVFFMAVIIRAL
ncbi:uncharacterized protein LOC123550505 [Mercenaria mercenaria]|uniref:uncharacterized protein LOC123550505 n=1 Tax=Mercenaria mercenaria TaxID=6596 RepID=UPI00234EF279|nr:uncharacterized protein LOC123550505 [Mercenaria mercenaria]